MDSHARLHAELTGFLYQHCPAADERHLTLLGWMVAGLLISQTVCFGQWQRTLLLQHCLASSWQRRCRRWQSNQRIDVEALYGPLVLWAIQQWQKPDHSLHLALDTTVLWNRFCVVVPGGLPWPGDPADLEDAGASQCQRQRRGCDRLAAVK